MQLLHSLAKMHASFDDPNLVSHAGLVPVMALAERAGLGRTTFFRHYRSKEDVIFPDHDRLLEQIADRLRTSSHGAALVAVSDAVRLVLQHYISEGDLVFEVYPEESIADWHNRHGLWIE